MVTTSTSDLFSSEKRSFLQSLSRAWCEQVWAEHKYLVMAKSYRCYQDISNAFKAQTEREKTSGNRCWSVFTEELSAFLTQVRALPEDEGNTRNALLHAFGHLSSKLTDEEREEWLRLVETDLKLANERLFLFAMEHGDEYLQQSRLFAPDVPLANVWVRCKGESWFIHQKESGWEVLSPQEVGAELGSHRVDRLAHFRLAAQLGNLVQVLTLYQEVVNETEPLVTVDQDKR
ncbi:DUF1722 domain-containing protein [Brevibacillus fluminis]|uniref:DUF1722 domain-containing protein n=1 Tax=Brevibacillus fluminis TaxID=511487 RepID=A0A3M8DEY9_9BACL|nr:DUF1722 domain-containing protein [Brevibacillus fluminis]RNB85895.1 DUF1722 domain-containing protein [Brevibacillus fluminis]